MPQLGVGAFFVVFDPGLSLGCLLPTTWRGPVFTQSSRELHRTVLLRIWSCLSRPAASPIICVPISYFSWNFRISHSAFSLESLTVTSSHWTEVRIPRASSEYKHVLACFLRKMISSKLALPVLSSVTGAVRALPQQPTLPTAWSSSVSFRKLDVDSAPRLRMEARSSQVNHQKHCPFGCLTLLPR